MSQVIGFQAERQAKEYLIRQGLDFILANYHSRMGEIDLIMQDVKHLVFVEVRARSSDNFGGARESITRQKQQRIFKTATHYMCARNIYETHSARFDVLTLQGQTKDIEWIKNAFGPWGF